MKRTRALFARRLLGWYAVHQRRLPWRLPPDAPPGAWLDPYHVLVSEAMLQQTQVATVVPYFERFIARFPTVDILAAADLHNVLRLWQGLGYYSRARNLQKSAMMIVERFGGQVPSTVDDLLTLTGVGRYTAGAVASLAFNQRAPILDGNVIRVLCRLDGITADPRLPAVRDELWARAQAILPADRSGDFNSAMMELGATVCTPRAPACLLCPVSALCLANEQNLQESIPVRKPTKKTALHIRQVFCIESAGRFLVERRPPIGRWAGLWQFITITPTRGKSITSAIAATVGEPLAKPRKLGRILHALTHRRYQFDAYLAQVAIAHGIKVDQRWISLDELENYAMSVPQQKFVTMLNVAIDR